MKKFFSLFATVLFAGSMWAGVVTLDPATQTPKTSETDISLTIQGIGVAYHGTLNAATDGSGQQPAAPADFRVFAGQKLKLSASSNITKVVIAGKANKAGFTLIASKGNVTKGASYSDVTEKAELSDPLIVVESINAKEVTLTCGKQLRAYKIEVTLDGEGGGSEGGEGGDDPLPGDAISLDVVYADAGIFEDEDGPYWVLDLYKDYNEETEKITYPEVVAVFDAKSKTALAGTYTSADFYYAYYVVAEGDTIWSEELASDIKIEYNEGVYSISFAFVDEDEKTYAVDMDTDDLYAYTYNEETEEYVDVELDEDGGQGGDLTDPTNCAEAREAALSVSGNNVEYNGGKEYTIEGYVTKIQEAYSDTYHNISFWMADTKDGGNVLEAFRAACASEAAAPSVGDKVRVTGKLTKFKSTPEFAAGCTFTIIEKGEGGGGGQPSTEIETITVAKALQIGGALDKRASTTETYRIVGYVTSITEDSFDNEQYKNMTFWMADTKGTAASNAEGAFYAYRVKPDVKLAVGDKVSVETVIKKYENNDGTTLIESGTKNAKATKLTNTAVENSSVAAKSVKRIENAMLIIERNGVRYNVMGQIVR